MRGQLLPLKMIRFNRLLTAEPVRKKAFAFAGDHHYRGTSLIRNRPPSEDNHRALGIVLL